MNQRKEWENEVNEMNEIDKRVEELKKLDWEEMYEKDNERLERVHPPFKEMIKIIEYRFEWCLKQIKNQSNNTNNRILNIGSSLGILEHHLKEDGYENIYGLDVDDKTIERCKKNVPGVTFKKGYAEQLSFKDDTFDVVIATQVVEHLKDPIIALKEMKRVLKNNGMILVTVPKEKMLLDKMHLHEFDLYKLCHLFEELGDSFVVHEIHKWDKNKVHTSPNVFAVKYTKGDE